MSSSGGGGGGGFLNDDLSQKTSIFGLRLWVVIGIGVGALIVLILFSLSLWLSSRKRSRRPLHEKSSSIRIPMVSKEILVDHQVLPSSSSSSLSISVRPRDGERDGEKDGEKDSIHARNEGGRGGRGGEGGKVVVFGEGGGREGGGMYKHPSRLRALLDVEKACPGQSPLAAIVDKWSSASADSRRSGDASAPSPPQVPEVSHLGWGHWYTLRELEMATEGFCDSQVLGEGGYGIVYRGRLPDGTVVAVKNLLNNRGQAEKEFKVEVEVIGRVRHKNLVRLIGYCVEGSHRMLVYEYVDNGNLDQWLHGPLGEEKPLNWENRMKIILGTAKGLAYLHEGLEPKVVHRDVKSSNILLDTQWHPKVSDFGLAKLLGAGKSHVTTRVMGTFGYVAPEYASTGLLNERSDVYSFGVLLMELITGREPVDYARPAGEVNLVDWLKTMVGNRRSDEVSDPRLEEKPAPRVFKRALLVALRCVDPDSSKRPKMGQVVHMLEADDYPFRDDRRSGRGSGSAKAKDSPGRPPQFPSPDTRISPAHAIKDSPARRLAKIDDIEEELVEKSLGHKSRLRRYEF